MERISTFLEVDRENLRKCKTEEKKGPIEGVRKSMLYLSSIFVTLKVIKRKINAQYILEMNKTIIRNT